MNVERVNAFVSDGDRRPYMEKEQDAAVSQQRRVTCMTCNKNESRYTCPRCNVMYCSLNCYQNHNSRCCEDFARDNVEEAMRGHVPSEEEQNSLISILRRFHAKRGEDEELFERIGQMQPDSSEEDEIISKLHNLDLEDPRLAEKVPSSVLSDFYTFIGQGKKLSELVEVWVPWWFLERLSPTIEVLGEKVADETYNDEMTISDDEYANWKDGNRVNKPARSPEILEDIRDFGTICKVRPSPHLFNNLVNILYSYVYVKMLYNGDWRGDHEARMCVLQISTVLSENQVFLSHRMACNAAMERALNSPLTRVDVDFAKGAVRHVVILLKKGMEFIRSALSDLYRLFDDVAQVRDITRGKSSHFKTGGGPRSADSNYLRYCSNMEKVQKKIYFFLSWSKTLHEEWRIVVCELEEWDLDFSVGKWAT